MATVDYTKVPIAEKALYVPPYDEIVEVLSRGLRATFETVAVTAEDSPDLTREPFNLTAPDNGAVDAAYPALRTVIPIAVLWKDRLAGENPAKLVEVGGPPYLVPEVRRDKVYELTALLRLLRRDPALLLGAGAGPWPYAGVNCEGIINLSVKDGVINQGSHIVTVEPVGAEKGRGGYLQRRLPRDETRTALLGNYLVTDGRPGKVIKVVAEKRIGQSNFITAIRETLKEHYGDRIVGLGGTFALHAGRARFHVMPQFSEAPLCSDAAVDAWLHYFEMRAPLVHVGTLVTGDLGLDLRLQHFHGVSAHGDGGHYHGDTTPQRARYEGYFVPAAAVLRVDAPQHTHAFGRD